MTAKLRIVLMADVVTVAESENPALWQSVLGEILRAAAATAPEPREAPSPSPPDSPRE